MSAPTLPREVWAYVRTWPGESHGMQDVETFPNEHLAIERHEYDVRRGFTARLSPIVRYVLADNERPRCPVCLAQHEPVPVCHECVRLKAKREEREDVIAWLRRQAEEWGGGRDVGAVAFETAAGAIERGEHRRDGR